MIRDSNSFRRLATLWGLLSIGGLLLPTPALPAEPSSGPYGLSLSQIPWASQPMATLTCRDLLEVSTSSEEGYFFYSALLWLHHTVTLQADQPLCQTPALPQDSLERRCQAAPDQTLVDALQADLADWDGAKACGTPLPAEEGRSCRDFDIDPASLRPSRGDWINIDLSGLALAPAVTFLDAYHTHGFAFSSRRLLDLLQAMEAVQEPLRTLCIEHPDRPVQSLSLPYYEALPSETQ